MARRCFKATLAMVAVLVVESKISMLLKVESADMALADTEFGSHPLSTQPPAMTTREGNVSSRVAV